MNTIKKNGEKQQKFSDLSSHLELRDYLIKKANRLNNTADGMKKYMCHYTDLTAAIGIIKGKMWFVGSPFNMNDGLGVVSLKRGNSFLVQKKHSDYENPNTCGRM